MPMLTPSQHSLKQKHIETRPFIDGAFTTVSGETCIEKTCPANGAPLPSLLECGDREVNLAVAAAKDAFDRGLWRKMEIESKKNVLFRLADLIQASAEELAYLDTLETGRPLQNFIRDSIPKAVAALRWFSESADKLYDHHLNREPSSLAFITREPLGVVGIITPWNDPLVIALWKLSPALLIGNSIVIKPAEQSSFSTLRLAALAKEAGLPDGILNVITGRGDPVGKTLALHPDVRGIFFTGSSEIGKKIMTYAGTSNMKKVGLECGGKGAFIVTQNSRRLQEAASTLARSMFYNQGQICSAPSHLIVHQSVKEEFLELLATEMPKYLPGDPFDRSSEVGSVVSREQFERIDGYLRLGTTQAGRIIQCKLPDSLHKQGYYIPPTIFVDLPEESSLLRDEIFGPVLVATEYDDIQNAISQANSNRFGLAAAIWSDKLDEALNTAKKLENGLVHINSYGEDDNGAPFGGIKESGLGKDKSLFAFDEYSTQKTTWIRLEGTT